MTDTFDNGKPAINIAYKSTAALKKVIGNDEFEDLQICIAKAKGYLPWGKNNPSRGDGYFIQSIEKKFRAPFEQLVNLADPGDPLKEVISLAEAGLHHNSGFMTPSQRKRAKECIDIISGKRD
jgi:hypothetical protein